MKRSTETSIEECVADLPDPRVEGRTDHKLLDILVITICAVISAADTWVDVEADGEAKREWFETCLELPHGIPSHDAFGRVFSLLSPTDLQAANSKNSSFLKWVKAVAQALGGQVVAIDGKTLRHSYDHASNKNATAERRRAGIGSPPRPPSCPDGNTGRACRRLLWSSPNAAWTSSAAPKPSD